MVVAIGVNSRMASLKAMEPGKMILASNIWANTSMITCTAMEYTRGVKEMYTTESGKRVSEKAKDIKGGQTEMSTVGTTEITISGEKGYTRKTANGSETHMKKMKE